MKQYVIKRTAYYKEKPNVPFVAYYKGCIMGIINEMTPKAEEAMKFPAKASATKYAKEHGLIGNRYEIISLDEQKPSAL